MAQYIQDANLIDYTPAADVASGTVVDLNGGLAGIAPVDIAANEKGTLAIEGAIKADANASIAAADIGDQVGFDFGAQEFIAFVSGPSFRILKPSAGGVATAKMNV